MIVPREIERFRFQRVQRQIADFCIETTKATPIIPSLLSPMSVSPRDSLMSQLTQQLVKSSIHRLSLANPFSK